MPLSRTNFGFSCWPPVHRPPDESFADEAGYDGHRVLGQAELQVQPVPKAFEPPCSAVVVQHPHGAGEITPDDPGGPPVQRGAATPQPVEDGTGCGLILGGTTAFPAAPDHRNLGIFEG